MKTIKLIGPISFAITVLMICNIVKADGKNTTLDTLCLSGSKNSCNTYTENQNAYLHYLAGIKFDSDSDYEDAIKEFSQALKLDKNFSEAYDKRGVVFTKMLMFGKALKDLSKAIELNSNFSEAFNHRGIVYYCLLEYKKSLADYNKAITLDPSYAKVYYNRGIVKLLINDDNGAINDFRTASDMKFDKATDYLRNNSIVLKY